MFASKIFFNVVSFVILFLFFKANFLSKNSYFNVQAVVKKWSSYNIEGHENILNWALTLPYVPANKWQEALNILRDMIFDATPVEPKLFDFLKYLHRTWLPIADIVSVYKKPLTTNNVCENFNKLALSFLGLHSLIWPMLGNLSKI